ncbi:MAG: thiol:disulfide interchange protein DsbA/DsbL [Pseudomonadales bacterium]|jgi:thiol:disulfide interchange protein DsbA
MKRCLYIFLVWAVFSAPARAAEFEEGVHYQRLPVGVETRDDGKVEVVEVFSYACNHCKDFDPTLEVWRARQTDGVDFHRMPAIFNETYAVFGQAFYAADVLGVGEAVHTPIFRAVHERGVDLRDPSQMSALFHEVGGVSPDEFAQVFNSFGVRGRVQQADARARAYRISGVPALIIDGTFRVDGRMAGSNTRMLEITDFLVAQRRAEKGLQAAQAGKSAPTAPNGLGVQ